MWLITFLLHRVRWESHSPKNWNIFNFEPVLPLSLSDAICMCKYSGESGPLLLELMEDTI